MLSLAIVLEVVATSLLPKRSSLLLPVVRRSIVIGYGCAFIYCLNGQKTESSLGEAYAIWCGAGSC
ncbi:SMR family transporter [Vibrio chagasii]|nr:SMR family transporter [Vibrio chagasii]